ncbi:hypothetical protein [Aphanothece sacrum]|uniref:Notch homolog 2 n=1 Tax=Aphanothece sacrum FPU1 TaxID=1920663 RepID=A0A401IHN1_APHSA|nr:hypothetical protein [Aphanothece sacrum]GBF80754.1 notch homolog 2 [Aphanothece sacrum FPU1]GBF83249.1 hypothetical protein AsFPU3_0289 [Aphanothece sacrum FPU3]
MLFSVTGIYRDGQIQLSEQPPDLAEETQVIVTFISAKEIDLVSKGINREDAANLRANLTTFADDWNSPEMSIYDNYEQNRANLKAR